VTIEQALGVVMRRIRKERSLSQDALSAICNLDRSYISLIECGRKNPSLNSIFCFARSMDIPMQHIFSEVETLITINGNRRHASQGAVPASDTSRLLL
jgi:transcriptional regulator with XRE-family HTH domain